MRRLSTSAGEAAAEQPGPLTGTRADQRILDIASTQHGVVTIAQLRRAGVSRHAVAHRRRGGLLHRVHRGVYQIALPPPRSGEMAAVLACGAGAVISHLSAVALHDLERAGRAHGRRRIQPGEPDVVHVSVPHWNRLHPGIRVHRRASLPDDEVTEVDRIPVTTVSRTILDVAAAVRPRRLERLVAEAATRRATAYEELSVLVDRHAPSPGSTVVRALLDRGKAAFTRSEAEARFLALVRAAALDPPEVNARVGPYEVDFLWRRARVVVEVDGYAFHRSRVAFEADRRRGADLVASGHRLVRITWRQTTEEPERVIAQVAMALARASAD